MSVLETIFAWWRANPTATSEELRARLWDNWGRISVNVPQGIVHPPSGADLVFVETLADVAADICILEIAENAQTRVARQPSRATNFGLAPLVISPQPIPFTLQVMDPDLLERCQNFLEECVDADSPNEEFEIMARTTTTRKKASTGSALKKEPVYGWVMRSSKPYGGETVEYEVRLNQDGGTSCNCPSWRFARGEKSCKHTNRIAEEAIDLFKRYKKGEALPTSLEAPDRKETGKGDSDIGKFGRVIDF